MSTGPLVESFADHFGLAEACRARGLAALLEIRPVRLMVGAVMSMIYFQIVGDGGQPRQPARGDGYDLWHAVLASTADIFVTCDGRLAKSLALVPVDGFRVATSLISLLDARRECGRANAKS